MPLTYERLNVNLTERSSLALTVAAELDGLNKTDVVNRAVQLYSFLIQERAEGRELLIRDGDKFATIHLLG
jgi:hypothetical protein